MGRANAPSFSQYSTVPSGSCWCLLRAITEAKPEVKPAPRKGTWLPLRLHPSYRGSIGCTKEVTSHDSVMWHCDIIVLGMKACLLKEIDNYSKNTISGLTFSFFKLWLKQCAFAAIMPSKPGCWFAFTKYGLEGRSTVLGLAKLEEKGSRHGKR